MPWKSTMRSTVAAVRRMEREAQRRQRELAKQHAQLTALQEHQKAAHEVAVYEDYIDRLLSVHKECGPEWDWEAILARDPPPEPERSDTHKRQARELLDAFQPNLVDKLLGRVEKKRGEFVQAVVEAEEEDEQVKCPPCVEPRHVDFLCAISIAAELYCIVHLVEPRLGSPCDASLQQFGFARAAE